ncbi:conserved hypothetical protein [Aspergillus terreus NIH2624]|uniref:PX domain-containing protein n=1 Tax=Aspergillus terreus (strain NIH 2624 / FGSC A1156) TaxID=341663 RepID=Q0D1S0_ASPTN|nr:uncharacterized protein ATEG_00114 [Aspergillus terreus NIH2624]EAU38760.1 conserved hypothetical protein [Aspergillus terreus NIH2624]
MSCLFGPLASGDSPAPSGRFLSAPSSSLPTRYLISLPQTPHLLFSSAAYPATSDTKHRPLVNHTLLAPTLYRTVRSALPSIVDPCSCPPPLLLVIISNPASTLPPPTSIRPIHPIAYPPRRTSRWMEPANEVTGLPPRLPSSSPPRNASSPHHPADPTANPTHANGSSKDRPVSGIVPPYWSHHRNASRTSQTSLEPLPPITLEDHTEDPNSETSRGLWARSVSVDDHVVVQGKTGIGAYVVWNCTIQTLEGGPITIRMRYASRLYIHLTAY